MNRVRPFKNYPGNINVKTHEVEIKYDTHPPDDHLLKGPVLSSYAFWTFSSVADIKSPNYLSLK